MKNLDTIGGMQYNYRKEFVEACRQRKFSQIVVDGNKLSVTQRMSYRKSILAKEIS
jgi:hypothetical protein